MTRSSIKTFQPPIKGTPAWLVPLIKGPLTNIITKNFELQKILGKIPGAPQYPNLCFPLPKELAWCQKLYKIVYRQTESNFMGTRYVWAKISCGMLWPKLNLIEEKCYLNYERTKLKRCLAQITKIRVPFYLLDTCNHEGSFTQFN